jgi:hypothetical protein
MIENEIEDLIFEFIRKQIQEKESEVEEIKKKSAKELQRLEEADEKLREFEKKHHKELKEIYDFKYSPFSSSYNEFSHGIDYEPKWLKHQLECMGFHEGEILITYKDFEEAIGLNAKSTKKYLEILEVKGRINRKKVIFGYVYSIKKDTK